MDQPPNLIRHSISFPERPKTPKQLQESENQQEAPENNEIQNLNSGQFDSLIHDLERIKKRHRISYKQVNDNIDKIIKDLENVQNDLMEIEDVPENSEQLETNETKEHDKVKIIIDDLHNTLMNQKPLKNIFNNHKEYFAYISKMGKNLEKNFDLNLEEPIFAENFQPQQILNVIQQYLLRENNEELLEIFSKETQEEIQYHIRDKLKEIKMVKNLIKDKQLERAILWAEEHKDSQVLQNNNLLFQLYKFQYIKLLTQKNQDALVCAQKYFPQFQEKNQEEIQKLMTCILYKNNFETSPYANIFKEDNWNDLANLFEESACKINELLIQSALVITTKAGTLTLPQFLNLQKYFEVKEELNKNTEITIDFNYGNEFQFHSVFVCPVSREQIPPNQSPYRLSCGHIISKTSLDRIAQATTSRSKFKCPTCQTQIKKADIKEICF